MRYLLLLLILTTPVLAQNPVSSYNGMTARQFALAGSLPSGCDPNRGEVIAVVTAGPAVAVYWCDTPNHWTVFAGATTVANHTHASSGGQGGQLNASNIFNAGTVPIARLPVMVGDSGSGGSAGMVPAPNSGDTAAGKFLKADGTWSVPPGSTGVVNSGTGGQLTYYAITGTTVSGNSSLLWNNSTSRFTVAGGFVTLRTAVASSPYAVLNSDYYLGVDTTSARTINLPNSSLAIGQVFIIADETGSAGTNNITINGNGSNIDGASSAVVDVAYGVLAVRWTGNIWKIQ